MKERAITFLLFCSVFSGTFFHWHENLVPPNGGYFTPFPFLPDFVIHSESYMCLGLWRVRLMFVYSAFTGLALHTGKIRLWIYGSVLFLFEIGDLSDYLLRYGLDFLPNIDANVIKAALFVIVVVITYIIDGKRKNQA